MEEECVSPIASFYAGRSVFVTGATGFLGKVLLAKLLKSCPDVQAIYLLLRPKKGLDAVSRLQELLNFPIFDDLKKNHPECIDKLVVMGGDVSMAGLGLSEEDVDTLSSKVSVVFHSAARVKFDLDLKEAVEINVKGARRVMELARQLPHLQALVHVSTCYVHPEKPEADEIVYPPPVDPQQLIDCVDSKDQMEIQRFTDILLTNTDCTNVYAGSKAVSEHMLLEECQGLPLVIVRPSSVTASYKEPLPGWIDNINGPTGISAAIGKGFMRAVRADSSLVTDFIPVDYPVNLMIAAAWHQATYKPKELPVYNCGTSHLNPVTWGEYNDIGFKTIMKYPVKSMIWYPSAAIRSNYIVHEVEKFLYHYVPAYFIDTVDRLTGKKPRAVALYDRAHRLMSSLVYYTTRQWRFTTENLVTLTGQMSDSDRQTFDFDVRRIDWPDYVRTYVLGIRKFILKEEMDNLPAARRAQTKYYWIRLLAYGMILLFLYLAFQFVRLLSQGLHSVSNVHSHLIHIPSS